MMAFQRGLKERLPARKPRDNSVCQVILIGETGHGKSTLINYFTNYFRNGSVERLKVAIPNKFHAATEGYKSTEMDIADGTVSKTSECTMYEFEDTDISPPLKFRFMDTPGLSDSRGVDLDDKNINTILQAAENAKHLTAIVLVFNGRIARITVNVNNTIARMKSAIPDVLLDNLILVLTNCSSRRTAVFEVDSLPWKPSYIAYMENTVFSTDPKKWNVDDHDELSREFVRSMEVIENLLCKMLELRNVSAEAFKDMRTKRNDIKAQLAAALNEVKRLQVHVR